MSEPGLAQLASDLRRDEGLRLKPYHDSVGLLTIGYGRNLDDRGISMSEAETLLANDITEAIANLDNRWPWWSAMPAPARLALANMAFNLGIGRLGKFKRMIRALEAGDFNTGALEALDSRWAAQVGARAQRIATLFRAAERKETT